MLLTTTDLKVDYEVLGIVRGNQVKAAHLGRDIMAGLKNLVANAIVGIRFASSQIASGMAEILVYGTAVKI